MSRPIPATDETHGPFRKVVRVEEQDVSVQRGPAVYWAQEWLECGHPGTRLRVYPPFGKASMRAPARKRRRCWPCGHASQQEALAAKAAQDATHRVAVKREALTPEGREADERAKQNRAAFRVVGADDGLG